MPRSSTIFQKRDNMAVFQYDATTGRPGYRRFPHIQSKIADSAKYGVFTSQLHRFSSLCSTFVAFQHNAVKLLTEMVQHGYIYYKLRAKLRQFRFSYLKTQSRFFHKRWGIKVTTKERLCTTAMLHKLDPSTVALRRKWRNTLHHCDAQFR